MKVAGLKSDKGLHRKRYQHNPAALPIFRAVRKSPGIEPDWACSNIKQGSPNGAATDLFGDGTCVIADPNLAVLKGRDAHHRVR